MWRCILAQFDDMCFKVTVVPFDVANFLPNCTVRWKISLPALIQSCPQLLNNQNNTYSTLNKWCCTCSYCSQLCSIFEQNSNTKNLFITSTALEQRKKQQICQNVISIKQMKYSDVAYLHNLENPTEKLLNKAKVTYILITVCAI